MKIVHAFPSLAKPDLHAERCVLSPDLYIPGPTHCIVRLARKSGCPKLPPSLLATEYTYYSLNTSLLRENLVLEKYCSLLVI